MSQSVLNPPAPWTHRAGLDLYREGDWWAEVGPYRVTVGRGPNVLQSWSPSFRPGGRTPESMRAMAVSEIRRRQASEAMEDR